jgi:signal transduction histidine kinase
MLYVFDAVIACCVFRHLVHTVIVMLSRAGGLIVLFAALLAPGSLPAGEVRPRSILVIDQSDLHGPLSYEVFSSLRDAVNLQSQTHVTIYAESLDLNRFKGEDYQETIRKYVEVKYRETPIGALVVIGASALQLVLNWRAELWPGVPIVFAMVEEREFARLRLPPDVTGGTVKLTLSDGIRAARAVVPSLESVVFVGDAWKRQTLLADWKDEMPAATAGLNVIDIVGLTMTEIQRRVAALPDHSAILYSTLHSDGEGAFYPPTTALALVAEKANRPIIVAAELMVEADAVGGFVLIPSAIGTDTARRALRILAGEAPSNIPVAVVDAVKPVFNWWEMQRWGVGELALPEGSEVRFRDPSFWERYRWQSIAIASALLMQAGLISILLRERQRRAYVEVESRHRMTELAHINRRASVNDLSSSIAHELNQPLGSILTNTETAELILESSSPDLKELKEILADIRRDDLRAAEVIKRLRSFLKRSPFELKSIDINVTMRDVFDLLAVQASAQNVSLYLNAWPGELPVKGDPIQLQQVIVNLIINSMEAMAGMPYGRTIIGRTQPDAGSVLISISDSGPGIPGDKLNKIFDPFFTTKKQGMGVGLSIARTIVQAHQGRICAENQPGGGAVFCLLLPLAQSS